MFVETPNPVPIHGEGRPVHRDGTGTMELVTPPLYVAYRQAPTPADDANPIGSAGPQGTYRLQRGNLANPRHRPGMAEHAPANGGGGGGGPSGGHRFAGAFFAFRALGY